MQAYGEAKLALVAAPEICCLTSLLNSKKSVFEKKLCLTGSLAGMFFFFSFNLFFNAKIPSLCVMFGIDQPYLQLIEKIPQGIS